MKKHLSLKSKLTLEQFIKLFNSEEENEFYDLFFLKVYDTNNKDIDDNFSSVKIVPRAPEFYEDTPDLDESNEILKSYDLI